MEALVCSEGRITFLGVMESKLGGNSEVCFSEILTIVNILFTKIWSFTRRLMFLWFERTSMALFSAVICRAHVVVRGRRKMKRSVNAGFVFYRLSKSATTAVGRIKNIWWGFFRQVEYALHCASEKETNRS